jgi:ankyrin repeat protein
MNSHSSFAQLFHSRSVRIAATLAMAFASCTFAFCGPIHDAARKGDAKKIKALLAADPTLISSKDKQGNTPLHMAAFHGSAAAVAALLDAGADVNAKNSYQAFVPGDLWHFISGSNSNRIDPVILLSAQGVDSRDTANGYTPLDLALFAFSHKDVVNLLLAKGADVNAKSSVGATPLFWAVLRNQMDDAQLLVAKGADVNSADTYGDTLLDCALHLNFDKMAAFLVDKGADVNAEDQSGHRPLTYALGETDSHTMADLLRKHGAHE